MTEPLVSFAQNREDLTLYVLLNKVEKGFYVDVGANDPVIDSVTKFFYDRGWHGINVEPIMSIHERIAENRPRDINLNIGISNKPGELELREYGNGKHGWSTMSEDVKHERKAEKDYKDYKVKVETLKNVFKEHKVKEIDFLKIDVEGLEYEVLSSNDWKVYRPKVVVVEDTTPQKWTSILLGAGYQEIHNDGLNRYFVRSDLKDIHTLHDYKSVLLSGIPNITAPQRDTLKQLEATQGWLNDTQKELRESRELYNRLSRQVAFINENPSEYFGIKVLFSAFLKRLMMRLRLMKSNKSKP